MRLIRVLTAFLIVTASAVASSAQTITLEDTSAARAGVRIGYGGRGPDFAASFDSPRFADFVRFRADLGVGRWTDWFESWPPVGDDPSVMRMAGAVLLYVHRPELPPNLLMYGGVGFSAYLPRGVDVPRQRGTRLIFGIEGSGERWDIGPEVEVELPASRSESIPHISNNLLPTARIGVAIRRRF
jgi:hypothetical protein